MTDVNVNINSNNQESFISFFNLKRILDDPKKTWQTC
jgi:hypothetical protein